MEVTTYGIDRHDAIVSVDDSWSAFAVENGAPELAGGAVLGKPLWHFIAGASTQWIYREVLMRLRQSGRQVVLPFRCDSPGLRRFMHMEVSATPEEGARFVCRVMRVEPRAPVSVADLPWGSGQFVRMCSWCKRVEVDHGWKELESAIAELQIMNGTVAPQVTHGICPECAERVSAALQP